MRRYHLNTVFLITGLGLSAMLSCNKNTATPKDETAAQEASRSIMGSTSGEGCPILVPDVTVVARDIENGIALEFMTPNPRDVGDLRSRTSRLAKMYGMNDLTAKPSWYYAGEHDREHASKTGMAAAGPDEPDRRLEYLSGGAEMPSAVATAEEIENGMRVSLEPINPNEIDDLRAQARFHQQRLLEGYCWIYSDEEADGETPDP